VGVEVRPLGVRCNIQCLYCYQQPEREAGNVAREYDLGRIREAIEAEGQEFTLFGGDPLLVPERDLEELWALGLERFGRNGIQTNGALINHRHVEMFRRYKVHVGISIDGPGDLNDARWAGTLEKTREATRRTEESIDMLCREGMTPSLIVTLHRLNASAERLARLCQWIRKLDARGVRDMRLHLLEIDHPDVAASLELMPEENLAAMLRLLALEAELSRLRFDGFREMRKLLLGTDEKVTCTWRACDPMTTRAVRGIEGKGQRSNCGRTNKDGVDFVKSANEGFERYLALYETPQEAGGCRDCRFFLVCKGQCPGTAIDGDWRNRTSHCSVWMGLLETIEAQIESEGLVPLSKDPQRLAVERFMVAAWAGGQNPPLAKAVAEARRQREPATARPALGRPARRLGTAERLEFRLPENVRVAWVGDDARQVWEPRLQRILAGWRELEILSVTSGLRRCAAVPSGPEEIVRLAARATGAGLVALPVELQAPAASYRNASARPRLGEPWVYRVVLGSQPDVAAMKDAWDRADDAAIGDLLGYPACCRLAFFRSWVDEGLIDSTFPMAQATAGALGQGADAIETAGPPLTNMMWRWVGVRPVFHLPCGDHCAPTRDIAAALLACWTAGGFRDEAEWLEEILSWPCEWTALHGIAEIKTPILKIVATTDATATRLVVRRAGLRIPAEAPRGLGFAYRTSPALVTLTRRRKAGIAHATACV
jgi:uncharacterized protein